MERGIGWKGQLPWPYLPGDMKWFRETTTKTVNPDRVNALIMGRKTWESVPLKNRPLANRISVVLSRHANAKDLEGYKEDSVFVSRTFEDALELCQGELEQRVENVIVIGGASLIQASFHHPACKRVYYTEVTKNFECDTFIDPLPLCFLPQAPPEEADRSEKGVDYSFKVYEREENKPIPRREDIYLANPEETQYLELIKDILDNGVYRNDRTGTGTLAKFGGQMRFSLRDNVFPLLTTKRVFWRGVAEELLWFIAGSTSGKLLSDKGVKIWDANGSREFLDQRGLNHREVGDLGPIYGFQWRHFGAEYSDMHADYSGKGVDQLAECIHKIKNNPTDRRIVLSAWNPAALPEMALPPCHMFCQFFVARGELSCLMYQRSCDMGLGVPFNIASYALLTRLIAQVCGLKPGDFIHTLGDYHIYRDHIDQLRIQLIRTPRAFPQLHIDPSITDIDKFEMSHFKLEGYNPHPTIKMKMAV